jgi:hypothetical protein
MPAMMFMRRSVPEQPRSEATSGTKRHREVDSAFGQNGLGP